MGNLDLGKVYKISNEKLDMQYAVAMSGAAQLEVVRVLHSTSNESLDAIIRHGFKVGGYGVPVRNGQAHGSGVYLTTAARSAARYALKSRCNYILMLNLCRTFECVTSGEPRNNSRPVLDAQSKLVNVYVQPDKDLVYSMYIVEFQRKKSL